MVKKDKSKKLVNIAQKSIKNDDEESCNLKFSKCDENKYQLWNLDKEHLKSFVSFAKKIESMKWCEIKKSKGFHYEDINSLPLPKYISEDITMKSIRVTQEFRIYGYRMNADFYIIWFDPSHKLT